MNAIKRSDIQLINNCLQDELSKKVFSSRVMFSLTQDYSYIRNIVLDTKISQHVHRMLSDAQKDSGIVLDGAGVYGEYVFRDYPELSWLCVTDRDKVGESFCNLHKVIGREEAVNKYPDAYYAITSIKYYAEIEKELLSLGVSKKRIINIGRIAHDTENNMYFDFPFLNRRDNNHFIDCGAFHGENSINYVRWAGTNEAYGLAIEADESNYNICKEKMSEYANIKVINAAAYRKKGYVTLCEQGDSQSSISESGKVKVNAITIDDYSLNNDITMIKMDIEGSELDALKGAENTIKEQKPDLIISVYHKMEDIIELPKYILGLNSSYKMYLRHYMLGKSETVAFFV